MKSYVGRGGYTSAGRPLADCPFTRGSLLATSVLGHQSVALIVTGMRARRRGAPTTEIDIYIYDRYI